VRRLAVDQAHGVVAEAVVQISARDEAVVVLIESLEELRAALPRIGAERAGRFIAEERDTAPEAAMKIVLVDDAIGVAVEMIEHGRTPAPAPTRDSVRRVRLGDYPHGDACIDVDTLAHRL
jgi:hypothetical protein